MAGAAVILCWDMGVGLARGNDAIMARAAVVNDVGMVKGGPGE